jgi:hypothetical protein
MTADADLLIEALVDHRERLAAAGIEVDDFDQLLLGINCQPNPRAELLEVVAGYALLFGEAVAGRACRWPD